MPGEAGWQVRPLSVPDPEQLPTVEDLVAYEAVRLFLDRARGARPGFELRDDDAVPIATICRRLDGVPLALELAAARVVALAPAEIARRLDHRFALLSGGARGAPARHQSLRALVEWSHDLLDLEERVLLRRLSVFRGGCDLLAVEQVADGADLAASRVASVLASLVSKSMVTVEHGPGSRFRLLETVQSCAAERLDAAGESDAVGAAHLRWCRGLPPESLVARAGECAGGPGMGGGGRRGRLWSGAGRADDALLAAAWASERGAALARAPARARNARRGLGTGAGGRGAAGAGAGRPGRRCRVAGRCAAARPRRRVARGGGRPADRRGDGGGDGG